MKRKVWNKDSVPETRVTGLYIRVAPKSGTITLSKDLAELIKKPGINFVQDEARPLDWFIEPSAETSAFLIRSKSNAKMQSGYVVQNSAICREILKSSKLKLESTRFMVAAEFTDGGGYAILTKSAKQSE